MKTPPHNCKAGAVGAPLAGALSSPGNTEHLLGPQFGARSLANVGRFHYNMSEF